MRKIVLLLNVIAFVVSVVWLIIKPDYEPLITTILLLAGLIGFMVTNSKNKRNKVMMNQKAGKNSTQYQSGGDMTINN